MSDAATTAYFREQVLRKRPYLSLSLCREIIASPVKRQAQDDGRVRHWGWATLPNETRPRIFRVVTLSDGLTIHNAFPDRSFAEVSP